MSGGEVKPELREWLGPGAAQFCCITAIVDQRWFSGCLLQWVMSYFIFSLGLSRENGAWEGSFTAIKSISVPWVSQPLSLRPRFFFFFLMCLTPCFPPNSMKQWFQLRDTETKTRHGSFAHKLCGQYRNRGTTISPLETQAIFFNRKGAGMRKSRFLARSPFFLFVPPFCFIGSALQRERWSEW